MHLLDSRLGKLKGPQVTEFALWLLVKLEKCQATVRSSGLRLSTGVGQPAEDPLGRDDSSSSSWLEQGRDWESMWRKALQRCLFIFRNRDYAGVDSVKITFFLISHIRHYLRRQILQWRITALLCVCPVVLAGERAGENGGVSCWKLTPKGHFKEKFIPVGVVCKLYKLLPLEY